MQIRMLGLAACLCGVAYTASASDAWRNAPEQNDQARAEKPTLATHGYAWSQYQDQKPQAITHGYAWSQYQDQKPQAQKPALATHGYAWSQ
jgi:hypothetical protein